MKMILVITFAIAAATLASCSKDYTCTCVTNGKTTNTVEHTTKSKATDDCDALNTSVKAAGASNSCTLK